MNNYLLAVVGPTAIGKTSLAISLAQHYNTEIISADSRQFFKEMNIGTAVPTTLELANVKHHFIHNRSIEEIYDVGAFEAEAIQKLDQLFKDYKSVVMVGGSGLYIKAVTDGLDQFPKVNPNIRKSLNEKFRVEGLDALTKDLKKYDPLIYSSIDLTNPHRVIRAIEVFIASGKPYSSFIGKTSADRKFKTIKIGLTADRSLIYKRIEERVDLMIDEGLIDEVRNLSEKKHLNALNTVGYKEIFKYLEGEWKLDFAISEIKKNTRRFAKRQLTWFRKDPSILWFDFSSNPHNIIEAIDTKMATYELD